MKKYQIHIIRIMGKSILLTAMIMVVVLNVGYLFGEEMPDALTNGQITALIYIATAISVFFWGLDMLDNLGKSP